MREQDAEFVEYVAQTLIPDMLEEGLEQTATDFKTLVQIVERLDSGQQEAINFMDGFAMQAPPAPVWFTPFMPRPRPKGQVDKDEGGECHILNMAEIDNWDKEYMKQKMIQWPYKWAELQANNRALVLGLTRANMDRAKALLGTASAFMMERINAVGGCDHNAGICTCEPRHFVEAIERFLKNIDATVGGE